MAKQNLEYLPSAGAVINTFPIGMGCDDVGAVFVVLEASFFDDTPSAFVSLSSSIVGESCTNSSLRTNYFLGG